MNTAQSRHPDRKDLANLAKERLSRKKTQRILDHCKECPACADVLLEMVRSQPIAGERLVLSKWNWFSIAVLILSLIAVVVAMFWLLNSASRPGAFGLEGELPADFAETVVLLAGDFRHGNAPRRWVGAGPIIA